MKVLKYGQINDIPGFLSRGQPKWHRVLYDKWRCMWSRVYTDIDWIGCQIQSNYKYLSNYVNDIMRLDNFDLFKENPNGWSIDKDIKIPGNRDYYFEALSIIPIKDNSIERNYRRGNPNPSKPVIGLSNKIILLKNVNEGFSLGFDGGAICKCCKKKWKTYKGYKWYYINYKHGKVLRRAH